MIRLVWGALALLALAGCEATPRWVMWCEAGEAVCEGPGERAAVPACVSGTGERVFGPPDCEPGPGAYQPGCSRVAQDGGAEGCAVCPAVGQPGCVEVLR